MRAPRSLVTMTTLALAALVAISAAEAAAPRSKDIMQPIDTSPGSFLDPNNMLQVSLDRPLSVNVENQPALVVYNQLHAFLSVEFGYGKGVDRNKLVTLKANGPGREIMKSLGVLSGVRFEVTGPMQIRVMEAFSGPARKKPTEPPPVKIK